MLTVRAAGLRSTSSFGRVATWFSTGLTSRKGLALCFSTGLLVRLVPELLAFPLPIGFDTVYYAIVMKNGVVWPHWSTFFTSTWLFYAITVPLYDFSKVDPFLLLKTVAPLLYGLNVAGIYWFARKMLGWNVKMSLMAGGFFAVQLASLRISWDLLRNTLGMGLLLFTLPLINRLHHKQGFACFVLLSLLTVFAHEYSAVTLLAIVLGLVFWRVVRRRQSRVDSLVFLGVLPALSVFLAGLYLRVFPIKYVVNTNLMSLGEATLGRLFFFANYLTVDDVVYHYHNYWSLALDVLVLFALLYLPYLLLVWKGFFKNSVLNIWTGLLLVGSFGCLVVPFFALDLWDRWMFMLVFPFTFYAINGFSRLLRRCNEGSPGLWKLSRRKANGMILLTVLLGLVYLATPVLMNGVNVGIFSVTPASAHFSSAPTVPYQDVNDVIQAMKWLNVNMNSDSCVILHDAFLSWGELYLAQTHAIMHFQSDLTLATHVVLDRHFDHVYFVWWNQNIGWYSIMVPNYFVQLKDFGRVSIYSYVGENADGN